MRPPEVNGGHVASAAAVSSVPAFATETLGHATFNLDVVSASPAAGSNPSSAAAAIASACPEPSGEELMDEGGGPADVTAVFAGPPRGTAMVNICSELAPVSTKAFADRERLLSVV